jgi:preprotein translocase subunit SecF
MFGVVLVGTYTSVFIASPILIYLGVGANRVEGVAEEPEPPPAPKATATPPQRGRARR